jgi:hypothetical protein
MRLPPTLLIKRMLMVMGVAGVVGALLWTLWPKPVLVDVAELRKGGDRGRRGQDPHQGRLRRIGANHRQAGAALPCIVVGHPAMPRFTFEPREINALLTYISGLKNREPAGRKKEK